MFVYEYNLNVLCTYKAVTTFMTLDILIFFVLKFYKYNYYISIQPLTRTNKLILILNGRDPGTPSSPKNTTLTRILIVKRL